MGRKEEQLLYAYFGFVMEIESSKIWNQEKKDSKGSQKPKH